MVKGLGNDGSSLDSKDEKSNIFFIFLVNLVAQITVEPEEAIVVLLDISGSMKESFYECKDL